GLIIAALWTAWYFAPSRPIEVIRCGIEDAQISDIGLPIRQPVGLRLSGGASQPDPTWHVVEEDGNLRICEENGERTICRIPRPNGDGSYSWILGSPKGRRLVAQVRGSSPNQIDVWDANSGVLLRRLVSHYDSRSLSHNGRYIALYPLDLH